MKYHMNNETELHLTADRHHSGCQCSLCGGQYRRIAFKGGYVCESCMDYIKGLT